MVTNTPGRRTTLGRLPNRNVEHRTTARIAVNAKARLNLFLFIECPSIRFLPVPQASFLESLAVQTAFPSARRSLFLDGGFQPIGANLRTLDAMPGLEDLIPQPPSPGRSQAPWEKGAFQAQAFLVSVGGCGPHPNPSPGRSQAPWERGKCRSHVEDAEAKEKDNPSPSLIATNTPGHSQA